MPLKIFQEQQSNPIHTIAIAAGKGGVGKSTFTVLLAAALKRMGEPVGVLDADLYGPSIRSMLPEDTPPTQTKGQLIPAMARGIKMISMAFFQNDMAVRAPIANRVILHFLKTVAWGPLKWLLIDFPPGRGDIPLTMTQKVSLSGALMITTPQKIAAFEVLQAGRMFRKVGVPVIGVVENMSYYGELGSTPFGAGAGEALAEDLGVPFLGKIPLDANISKGGDQGTLADVSLSVVNKIARELNEGLLEQSDPISALSLADPKTLRIVWANGEITLAEADLLQRNCPCAQCGKTQIVKKEVEFIHFERVGRYALRFDFSSGCSYGIYSFELIKKVRT